MTPGDIVNTYRDTEDIISWTLLGFIVGVVVTVFGHTLLWSEYVHYPTIPSNNSNWIVATLLVILVLVLCYTRNVRCSIILAIPILFSSRGRSLIVSFAFVLVAVGPAANIIKNMDVVSDSLSCGQMQLREALRGMIDVMKRPLDAMGSSIITAIAEIRKVIRRVQVLLLHIKEMVLVVVAGIKNAFSWLQNVVSMCNKEFGTPFQRCMKIADDAIKDCRSKLGQFQGLCNTVHLFSMLCYTVKFIDAICVLVDFVKLSIIDVVMKRLKQFTSEVKNIFAFSVTFDHDFYFKTTPSKEMDDVGQSIMQDLHGHMKPLFVVFGWLHVLGSFVILIIVIKTIYFKRKYLHDYSYQNKYITKELVEIENQRRETDQELVFPLTSTEAKKYPWLTSCRLTRSEVFLVARSTFFLAITSIQILSICLFDYSFYRLLATIAYYGSKESNSQVTAYATIDVKGGGFIGEVLGSIARAFEPLNYNTTIDVKTCLPIANPPNYRRYWDLGFLSLFAWMLLILQPYGLRLRHVVMRYYYPEVAQQRAAWLYQRILLKRATFFKTARRKARNKYKSSSKVGYSLCNWIRAKISRTPILRSIIKFENEFCIICSKPLNEDKIACETKDCEGVYCEQCYRESNNMCCVCKNPIDYGDFSDISEVKDSSDELTDVYISESYRKCMSNK